MIIQGDEVGLWVSERLKGTWFPQGSIAFGQTKDGKINAGVIFDRYNHASISSSIAVEAPLTREFVKFILNYAFNTANVNCIVNVVSTANAKSLRLTEHFGFKRVAVIPNAMPDGDMVIYTITKEQCKFMR